MKTKIATLARAQPVGVARPRAGAQGLDSGRHGGAGEDGSRGADEGRRDSQAQAAGRYGRRPCGRGAVIRAGSRRASRRFAPPVCAPNDNGERKVSILDALEARARTVCKARARAGETVKRRRLAARDGAPADAAQ